MHFVLTCEILPAGEGQGEEDFFAEKRKCVNLAFIAFCIGALHAYHPSGDGLVERFNQTLERLLSHNVAENQRDWDVQLPAMLLAYRATPQSSTGYTPAYLLFGRELCLPQDVAYGLPAFEQYHQEQPAYVRDLRQRLAAVHAILRHRLEHVHKLQCTHCDVHVHVPVQCAC